LFDGAVDRVTLPGSCGPFTVLENHAPLISTLLRGEIVYVAEGKEVKIAVEGGIVEVRDNQIAVCLN
ncbi:MAG: F0F1 ATP synthase subunit epsilon, partial [Odoribacter sp.]|nr:F0F1 ATP synthase subunit epsilon [Odoribacter sp.]